MSQLPRLISILTLLKSRRVLTATELSGKFDVSIRTVYRDIAKLIEAGVPVITLEGRGYTLMDGYTVAPVQFTEKQANALITAQHLVNKGNDSSFSTDFEEALTKIKSVFRSSVLEKTNCSTIKYMCLIISMKAFQAMRFQNFNCRLPTLFMWRSIIERPMIPISPSEK